jgi:hypothetical protein
LIIQILKYKKGGKGIEFVIACCDRMNEELHAPSGTRIFGIGTGGLYILDAKHKNNSCSSSWVQSCPYCGCNVSIEERKAKPGETNTILTPIGVMKKVLPEEKEILLDIGGNQEVKLHYF